MKKRPFFNLIFLIVFLSVSILGAHSSHAFWIWTPKTNKLENPKHAPKDTPEEQYDWAMRYYNKQDFQHAADEFVRLTKAYKDSDMAPEAQYYAGRSYEELGKYWFAYENYQKTIENYPYTQRLEEILEREYNIANILRKKESPKLMELELNLALERAVIIYGKVVDNSPFTEYADKSLFYMAECYRRQGKYSEAIDTYDKLITDYPSSSLVEEAKIQLAETTYEASLDPDYDQESTDMALERFKQIMETTSVPGIAVKADEAITILMNRKAESIMQTAEFYEKRKKYISAIMYYQDVVVNFPETNAAQVAREKIALLEGRIKK